MLSLKYLELPYVLCMYQRVGHIVKFILRYSTRKQVENGGRKIMHYVRARLCASMYVYLLSSLNLDLFFTEHILRFRGVKKSISRSSLVAS